MQNISLIVAVDELNGIGADNKLLWHLPADLAFFKNMTLGKPIVMGKNTYLSIGRPLPKRINIVITHHPIDDERVISSDNIQNILECYKDEPEIMIIGGASIYKAFLPIASKIYLTKVHHRFDADTFFPTLDKSWKIVDSTFRPKDELNPYDISFQTLLKTPI